MVRRDYQCKACEFEQEEYQPIKADYLTICPSCGEATYGVIFKVAPMGLVQAEPKTLGVQASRNTKKMGNAEVQERIASQKAKRQEVIKARREQDGLPTIEKPKETTPWWRPGTTAPNTKLTSLTPTQTAKYIETGETK